jgi:hypothetical protein
MTNHLIRDSRFPSVICCLHCGFAQYLRPSGTFDTLEDLERQIARDHRHCPPPPELPWRFEKRRRGRGGNLPTPPQGPQT